MGAGLGGNSLLMKFSRGYEKDADLNGARMVAAAGYNPIELPNFFEKLQAKMGSAGEPKGLALWMSSHPASGSRIEYVSQDIKFYPKTTYSSATGNFSYQADRMHGDRYILIGDAFAFIDPVLSSGVLLAMNSAFLGADAVDASLRNAAPAPALLRKFDRSVRSGLGGFTWFIYRMTQPSIRDMFMHPGNWLRMQEAVLSLLAGDLIRRAPIRWSLRAFKSLYYVLNLAHPRRSFVAWRHHRRTLRERLVATPGS